MNMEMTELGCVRRTLGCEGVPVLRPLERTEHYDIYRCSDCGSFYCILLHEEGRKQKESVSRASDVIQNGLKDVTSARERRLSVLEQCFLRDTPEESEIPSAGWHNGWSRHG